MGMLIGAIVTFWVLCVIVIPPILAGTEMGSTARLSAIGTLVVCCTLALGTLITWPKPEAQRGPVHEFDEDTEEWAREFLGKLRKM